MPRFHNRAVGPLLIFARASIGRLFQIGSPAAIFWRVRPIIVDPLNTCTFRPRPHGDFRENSVTVSKR